MNKPTYLIGLLVLAAACEAPAPVVLDQPSEAVVQRPRISPERRRELKRIAPETARRALSERQRDSKSSPARVTLSVARHAVTETGDTHVWLRQHVDGVPVRYRDIGAVVSVDGRFEPVFPPDDLADLQLPPARPEEARRAAEAHLRETGVDFVSSRAQRWIEPRFISASKPLGPEQFVATGGTRPDAFEVGHVVTLRSASGEDHEIFVRDADGALDDRGPQVDSLESSPRFHTLYSGTVEQFTNTTDGRNYFLRDQLGNEVLLYDGASGTPYVSTTNDWGDGLPFGSKSSPLSRNGQTAAADAYVSMKVGWSLWRDVFDRDGYDDQGGTLKVFVHERKEGANYFGHGEVYIGYDSLGVTPLLPYANIEIFGHELGHAIFRQTGIPPGHQGELGGLNEGTADIFGVLTGFHAAAMLSRPDDRLVLVPRTLQPAGNWHLNGPYFPIRSLSDPAISAWDSDLTQASRYATAGPIGLFFYFLSVGVLPENAPFPKTPRLDQPARKSPFLPKGMAGLTVHEAARIWYATLTSVYFTRVGGFHDARAATLLATRDLYTGLHSPEYKAVEDAFAAVNVGPPADRTAPEVSISVTQLDADRARVTVDLSDENDVAAGTITVDSGIADVPDRVYSCTGHCEFELPTAEYSDFFNTVHVKATDTRRNEATSSRTFTVDTRPPAISFEDITGSQRLRRTFRWSASDQTRGLEMRIRANGEVIKALGMSGNSTGSAPHVDYFDTHTWAQGTYAMLFEVSDAWGHVSSRSFSFYRDRTPPAPCTLSVPTSVEGVLTGTIRGDDVHSRLSSLLLIVDGNSAPAWSRIFPDPGVLSATESFSIPLEPGTHTVKAVCYDIQANHASSATVTVRSKLPEPQCNTMQHAGADAIDERTFTLPKSAGTFSFRYDTVNIADRIQVFSAQSIGDVLLYDSGCVSTYGYSETQISYFNSPNIKVRVTPHCEPYGSNTIWSYFVGCP